MEKYIIEETSIPKNSLADQAFPCIHYSDSYKAILSSESTYDVDSITRLFLISAPTWVTNLMKIRDRLVSLIGLKTSSPSKIQNITLKQGSSIGIFRVINRASNEILLGEDDRHLNFRVSILLDEADGLKYVTVSTVVYFNNWLGRLYFVVVRKVHKAIVSAMLKNMVRNI
ncbi:DUF2867 domain-containing protein [Metabacillus fastidiosus]|uniref:DUF2867 domain-containing protein n=1 Tax=Metabacillus fastidiosus TaxID=1458 RepID=UPI002DB91CC6|nr:DUF2867 domain-containing protein [Metabacillus fastidiosus]MEC2076344.1 DUF2867 domain-containing protein [Metabacillus fastidiosus]